jgi:hypothetical protein
MLYSTLPNHALQFLRSPWMVAFSHPNALDSNPFSTIMIKTSQKQIVSGGMG